MHVLQIPVVEDIMFFEQWQQCRHTFFFGGDHEIVLVIDI